MVSVGEHVYLALAKGGLVPFHLLILPITHLQSTSDLDKEAQEGRFIIMLTLIMINHMLHNSHGLVHCD